MKKQLTPEDRAIIQSTYRNYILNVKWIVLSIALGIAVGATLATIFGPFAVSNPVLWIGLMYGAAIPATLSNNNGAIVRGVLFAPALLVKDFLRRFNEMAEGRRVLQARFAEE